MVRISIAALLGLIWLGGCRDRASIEYINAAQADALNDIAANTSETAGNAAAAGDGITRNIGDVYRAGAKAPPHHY